MSADSAGTGPGGYPETLHLRAHAKINLALRVGPRDPDGYHPLATIFQTISLADRLIARPLAAGEIGDDIDPEVPVSLTVLGAPLPESNTVTRAAGLLAGLLHIRAAGELRPIALRQIKRVPIGAGLGGGSSDAVAALVACCRLWNPGGALLPRELLAELAVEVGADVPYFLYGGTALGTGRGERIEPVEEIPPQWLVIAAPCSLAVSTAAVYAAFDRDSGGDAPTPPAYTGRLDPAWMENDLQATVIGLHPEVEETRRALLEAGAGMALMSGSGAASFGTFADRRGARRAARALRAEGLRAWACCTVSARQHARGARLTFV